MSHRRPREQEWSPYDSDEDRRPRRSTRHRDPESEYIRPSGYESPPPNYSEAPRARDRGRSDRDDTRRQAPRHHSSDAYRSSAAPRRRYDNYPSDSEDSEEEYRRRARRQKPRDRDADADRDRGRHYPPRAGGDAPRRGREGTYYPPRAGDARPAPPSRTRSWSETFASSGAKDKVMAAGSAALAAGAAEAWRCRKDKGKLMEKGFKVGTAAAGAAAVAAFKNGGKEAENRREGGRRDDRDRGRRDDRYDDRYEERGGGGGGKTDAIKSAIGGILVSKMAKGFMGGK